MRRHINMANVIQSKRTLVLLMGFESVSNLIMSSHDCHRGDKSQGQNG